MALSMELTEAVDRVLQGESLRDVFAHYRDGLLVDMGFDPEEAPDDLFRKETMRFVNQLCRRLGEHHDGDRRAAAALVDWVRECEEYDAFDALLSHFEFDSRDAVITRGRVLFPGPLTAHWGEVS